MSRNRMKKRVARLERWMKYQEKVILELALAIRDLNTMIEDNEMLISELMGMDEDRISFPVIKSNEEEVIH